MRVYIAARTGAIRLLSSSGGKEEARQRVGWSGSDLSFPDETPEWTLSATETYKRHVPFSVIRFLPHVL